MQPAKCCLLINSIEHQNLITFTFACFVPIIIFIVTTGTYGFFNIFEDIVQ